MVVGFAADGRGQRVIDLDASAKPEQTRAQILRIARHIAELVELIELQASLIRATARADNCSGHWTWYRSPSGCREQDLPFSEGFGHLFGQYLASTTTAGTLHQRYMVIA